MSDAEWERSIERSLDILSKRIQRLEQGSDLDAMSHKPAPSTSNPQPAPTIDSILDGHAEYYVRETMRFFQNEGISPAISKDNEGDLKTKSAIESMVLEIIGDDDPTKLLKSGTMIRVIVDAKNKVKGEQRQRLTERLQ